MGIIYKNGIYYSGGGGSGGAEITVDNELSSTSENPVQNKVIKGALDSWSSVSQVSSGSVTFSNIDDTDYNGYELYINVIANSVNKNPINQITSISGSGTNNMSITFSTDADEGSNCKLRILR